MRLRPWLKRTLICSHKGHRTHRVGVVATEPAMDGSQAPAVVLFTCRRCGKMWREEIEKE